jgi:hypothetical protein
MFRSRQSEFEKDPRYQEFVRSLWEHRFGSEGLPPDLDFASIEEMAHQIGKAVAREFCEQVTAQQARSAEQPQPCPDCGRACDGQVAARELLTRDGPISLDEAQHHCPRCRRAFFPQSAESASEPSSI